VWCGVVWCDLFFWLEVLILSGALLWDLIAASKTLSWRGVYSLTYLLLGFFAVVPGTSANQ